MSARFLGRGWAFPVDVNAAGTVEYAEAEQKILESIQLILATAQGERLMRPDFGSRLRELVFAPLDASTRSLASRYATEALVEWEPRIDVLQVNARTDSAQAGVLLIEVEYRVRATNSVFNLVYPFYLQERSG